MKILEVTTIGITWKLFVLPLAKCLIQKGHRVEGLCHDHDNDLRDEIRRQSLEIPITSIPIPRSIGWQLIGAYRQIYQAIRQSRPDVVHTHTPIASVLARHAARKLRVPVIIYTAHGFYFHDRMNLLWRVFFFQLEKHMAKRSTDWIFCVNREDAQLSRQHRFLDDQRIIRIPGVGVDALSRFNPELISDDTRSKVRMDLGIPDHVKVLVFVGRMVAEKGVFELLEAFREVLSRFPDAYLIMVGDSLSSDRDQKTRQKLAQILSDPILSERIRMAGFRTDIPEILSIGDLFVLPSHREGFPVSSLEAMSMGLPVIATKIRGLSEQVLHGQTGLLAEVGDTKTLQAHMETGLQEGHRWREAARQRVLDHYTLEHSIHTQLEVFDRIRQELEK